MAGLLDALKQYVRDALPGGLLNPEVKPQDTLDAAALSLSPVPLVGDAAGLLADGYRYATDPSSRTPINYGLSALGALPFVPAMGGILKNEISTARALSSPRTITLPNGVVATITANPSMRMGEDATVRADLGNFSATFPGYIPINHSMFAGLTPQDINNFARVRQDVANAQQDLIDWKAAKQYVLNEADAPVVRQAQPTAQHADADWWRQELKIGGKDVQNAFLTQAAKADDFFLYGRPAKGSSADEIVSHYARKSGVPLDSKKVGNDLLIRNTDTGENMSIFGVDSAKPVIRSTEMERGSGSGKPAYQTAYSILDALGKKAYPDTGLTQVNDYRKLSNVMAGDLRAGRQVAVQNSSKVGRNATPGDMLLAEAKETRLRSPQSASVVFDGNGFSIGGRTATDSDIAKILGKESFGKSVGVLSAKRAAVSDYLQGLNKNEAKELAKNWKWGALLPAMVGGVGVGLLGNEQVGAD